MLLATIPLLPVQHSNSTPSASPSLIHGRAATAIVDLQCAALGKARVAMRCEVPLLSSPKLSNPLHVLPASVVFLKSQSLPCMSLVILVSIF